MNSDLKRVGLVFKNDGEVDFKKSLQEVNNSLKTNYNNLKLAQSAYDSTTTKTQKLRDSFNYFNEACNNQKDKLKILEEQLRSLEDAEGDHSKEIAKVKDAMTQTQIKINNYNNEMKKLSEELKKSSDKFDKFSEKATKVGEKLEGAGKKVSVLGAGLAGLGAMSIKSMDEVDEGLDIIATKTGATGDAAKQLQSVYNNLASTIPADFGDIGAAVGEINTRLDFTGQALEDSSRAFLKFAKVNGTDVNTSVQLVTRAMGDAGIASSEYQNLLDMLTVAGQKSGISIDTLTTNLAKYGAPMRALGIDTKEAIALFAGWEKAGVNTEIAFSGMKKAISTWAASGKDAKKEFKKTLNEIAKCPTIAKATTKAIEVFGTKAGPDLADAIKGGRFAFDDYVAALNDAGGAIESTYGQIVDEVDDTQLASQNAKLALHDLGETFSKMLGPILLSISEKFKSLMDKFNNLSPTVQKIITGIGTAIVVLGPALILLGKFISSIKTITIAFKTFQTAVKGGHLLVTIFTSKITLIIAAVALVVAAIAGLAYVIYSHWEQISNWTSEFIGKIKNFFIGLWDGIKSVFHNIIDFISVTFTEKWRSAWNGIKSIFKGVFDGLLFVAKAPINGIIGLMNVLIEAINFVIRGINKISFDVPDWVPGIGGKKLGFNLNQIDKISYLAKGGDLISGSAVVAEAGPELLMQQGNKTRVVPLSGSSSNSSNIIDYKKLLQVFIKALNSCKMSLDKDGFVRFIEDELLKVV